MSEAQVTVSIYGTEFTLRTEDDPEQLRKLAAEVDREMRRIAQETGLMQPQKVAALTALHLADELAKLRTEHEAVDGFADRLARLLDKAVGTDV